MISSLLNPDYEKKRSILERKERFQKKIEDLELDAAVLDQEVMRHVQELDRIKNRMPLAFYLPYKV